MMEIMTIETVMMMLEMRQEIRFHFQTLLVSMMIKMKMMLVAHLV